MVSRSSPASVRDTPRGDDAALLPSALMQELIPLLVQLVAPPVIVTPEIVAVTPELTVMTLEFAPVASIVVLPAPAPVRVRFMLMVSGKVSLRAVLYVAPRPRSCRRPPPG